MKNETKYITVYAKGDNYHRKKINLIVATVE